MVECCERKEGFMWKAIEPRISQSGQGNTLVRSGVIWISWRPELRTGLVRTGVESYLEYFSKVTKISL